MQSDLISVDDSARLIEQVRRALAEHKPLRIRGGDSKAFLGRPVTGEEIDTRSHRGIVSYDPGELVITARAGTPLAELNVILDKAGQMLPCEPPSFNCDTTIGGVVASGLSGPRRPWSGSVRDFILGCRVITAEAKHLRFGGEVMKNVAGYDVSRLISGSFGCLALISEVSLKVLPKPRDTRSLTVMIDERKAMRKLLAWRRAALPISGACHIGGKLHVRLEGGVRSVSAALDLIGGQDLDLGFWASLRDHRLAFFGDSRPLWRLSLPNHTPLMALPGDVLIDWGGAQRWLKSDAAAATIRQIAGMAGGHATCFSHETDIEPFHPIAPALMRLHRQLKARLDPSGIFNPGRIYADF